MALDNLDTLIQLFFFFLFSQEPSFLLSVGVNLRGSDSDTPLCMLSPVPQSFCHLYWGVSVLDDKQVVLSVWYENHIWFVAPSDARTLGQIASGTVRMSIPVSPFSRSNNRRTAEVLFTSFGQIQRSDRHLMSFMTYKTLTYVWIWEAALMYFKNRHTPWCLTADTALLVQTFPPVFSCFCVHLMNLQLQCLLFFPLRFGLHQLLRETVQ